MTIINGIINIVNDLRAAKADKVAFCGTSFATSIAILEAYFLLTLIPQTPTATLIATGLFCWLGIPTLLIPIYGAVFDCYVDEDMKETETPHNTVTGGAA